MGVHSHLKTFLLKADRAYRMRIEGLPLDRIAEMLGESEDKTRALLKRKLAQEMKDQESEEETRAIELSRLDYLVNQLMGRIQGDGEDNKAIELLLKCQVRRAGLLGTDLGKQGEINLTERPDSEILAHVERLMESKNQATSVEECREPNEIAYLDDASHS